MTNDISFEKAIKTVLPKCEIHTFDPTLKTAFVGDAYAHFHPWGLGIDGVKVTLDNTTSWTGKSLETMMKELGHVGRTIDILKVDCEHCEWESMPPIFQLVTNKQLQINQIQLEMHNWVWGQTRDLTGFFQAGDRANMRLFHKERNHWGCYGTTCLEFAFASASFLRQANADVIC